MDYTEIRAQDKCRDFNWVQERFKRRQLYIEGQKIVTEDSFNQLRIAIRTAQEVHTGSWDLKINQESTEDWFSIEGIIVHFEEFPIVNSRGATHPIQDLFVIVKLSLKTGIGMGNLNVSGLDGFRTTYGYKEYISNYTHSHLPTSKSQITNAARNYNINQMVTSFCRGSGHINDFIAEVNCDSDGITEINFTPFMVQILGLVSWESLEGGPHRKIASIKLIPASGSLYHMPTALVKDSIYPKLLRVCKHIKNNSENDTIPLNFKLENDSYVLLKDETFAEFVKQVGVKENIHPSEFMCIENLDGQHYRLGQTPGYEQAPDTDGFNFVFQGREIPIQIESPPTIAREEELKTIVYPEILEQLKKHIEYDVNFKKIRKSTVDKYSN
jgi:hypothetical protein